MTKKISFDKGRHFEFLKEEMATYQIPSPDQVNCNGDIATNWKTFRESYEDYIVATGLDQKDKIIQVATLKSLMGIECKKILKRLQLSEDEMKDPKTILDKLQDHFLPVRNILYERYVFHNTDQLAHETIDQFVIKLRQLAEPCQFGIFEDEMVRDRLVLGCKDSTAKTRLFREKDCDLKKAIESLRISEATGEQLKRIERDETQEPVNFVKKETTNKFDAHKQHTESKKNNSFGMQVKDGQQCRYCGGRHERDKKKCPAFGKTCRRCGKFNHFQSVCQQKHTVYQVQAKLRLYDESLVQVLGECDLQCKFKGELHSLNFKVVSDTQQPLLSGETCTKMGLITVHLLNKVDVVSAAEEPQDIFKEYKDVFEGLSCLPGEYHLEVDPSISPVKHTVRRVAIPLKSELKKHIEELEKMQVLKKVIEPTDWISSQVVVRKGNKLRLCIDPRDLNKALKRSHYPMPTIEEVFPELSKAKMFSVADAKNGFWQIKLDEPSSYLTTFWTPFGRYRWLRMPFGLATAPEEYQRRQHEVLEELHGIHVIADDILITGRGETEEEALKDHDHNLVALLKRAREVNLKLNPKKLKLRLSEVPYIGQLLTSSGVKPDPDKVVQSKRCRIQMDGTEQRKLKPSNAFSGL